MTSRLLFVDACPETAEHICIAASRDGGIPQSWRSLDPAVARIQVRAFMAGMECGDGLIHSTDLPSAFIEALESAKED